MSVVVSQCLQVRAVNINFLERILISVYGQIYNDRNPIRGYILLERMTDDAVSKGI